MQCCLAAQNIPVSASLRALLWAGAQLCAWGGRQSVWLVVALTETDPASQSCLGTAEGKEWAPVASETSFVTSSQDPAVPWALLWGGRGEACFVFWKLLWFSDLLRCNSGILTSPWIRSRHLILFPWRMPSKDVGGWKGSTGWQVRI